MRGELLGSEELLSLFPEVTLCILQASPTLVDNRTSADREQAGKLRQLGAELFKLGVPFVLTVPPLPMAIGAAVIDEIGRGPAGGTSADRRSSRRGRGRKS